MKKALFGLIALCALFISSCASVNNKNVSNVYVYTSNYTPDKEYEILGPIEMRAQNNHILYFFVQNSPYCTFEDFVTQAKVAYPEADALINCYVDYSETNYYFGFKRNFVYHGTAIKCK